jgi:FixJ family two-component response regulator
VIVEDDVSLLGALTFALEAEGFRVHGFSAGGPLLAEPVRADCLVVDMRLPDTDGLRLISRLRELGVWSPAILVTTNPDQRIKRTAAAAGVPIVEKPLLTEELRQLIGELIAAHPR